MNAHDVGKAEAAAAVILRWKNVARLAREAGSHAFADHADAQAAQLENPAPIPEPE